MERPSLFIIDASVAVKWFAKEDLRQQALKVRDDYTRGKVDLQAPYLIRYEVGNALRFHPGSTVEEVVRALEALTNMQIITDEMSPAITEAASKISFEEGLAFYDAVYLALAEKNGTKVLTDDRKLYKKVRKRRGLLQLLERY